MIDERIGNVIECLRDDRREEYEALVKPLARAASADELWAAIGRADGQGFRVTQKLLDWPGATTPRSLLPAVAHLPSLDAASALQVLRFAGQLGQTYSHLVSGQLAPHFAKRPELAVSVAELLRVDPGTNGVVLRTWAAAFAPAAPKPAAEYALGLLTSGGHATTLLATLLQFLPMSEPVVMASLQPREHDIASALSRDPPESDDVTWHGLVAIASFSPTAMNELQQAVERGKPPALRAVAHWLYSVSTPSVGATAVPLSTLASDLLRHAVVEDDVRRQVDSGIASLLFRPTLRAVVLPCIEELGRVDGAVAETFGDIFERLSDHPDDSIELLTQWLVADDVTFAALRSLLARCTLDRQLIGINAGIFSNAPVARQVAAVRRLLALVHNGPALCAFVGALAEPPGLQPGGLEMAGQMLNEVFAEYPMATLTFLKERNELAGPAVPASPLYRDFLALALQWREVLDTLPRLHELRPTDSQLHALHDMRRRMNREVLRAAEERSIFAVMANRVQIAQGRRFASHTDHGPAQIVEMQETSHFIELPQSELADPVGGALRRARTLEASR